MKSTALVRCGRFQGSVQGLAQLRQCKTKYISREKNFLAVLNEMMHNREMAINVRLSCTPCLPRSQKAYLSRKRSSGENQLVINS